MPLGFMSSSGAGVIAPINIFLLRAVKGVCNEKGMTARNLPRLYMSAPLKASADITPTDDQQHYLLRVLRLKAGDAVLVFNGADGEFLARILETSGAKGGAKRITLTLESQQRPPEKPVDLTLAFAPLRRHRLESMLEKATELGVARLCPVITEFTQNPRLNIPRLTAITREASEQSARVSVPVLENARVFAEFVENAEGVIWCDEVLAGDNSTHFLTRMAQLPQLPTTILIGPEGGFSDAERRLLLAKEGVYGVSLGGGVLRADTAAVVALALWQGFYTKRLENES